MNSGLMIALDMDDGDEAASLAVEIGPRVSALKVGSQLFTRNGPALIHRITACGASVFLDLKYHDIPNTVAAAVRGAADLGVSWLTVHASGGAEMIRAAKEASGDTRVLAVTVLTSLERSDLARLGWKDQVRDQVLRLGVLAREAGADGIVCSAQEVGPLREAVDGDCILVTPGIRPSGSSTDDQARVATPAKAVAAGADYLVVGRPVVRAADPGKAVDLILEEMRQGDKAGKRS